MHFICVQLFVSLHFLQMQLPLFSGSMYIYTGTHDDIFNGDGNISHEYTHLWSFLFISGII